MRDIKSLLAQLHSSDIQINVKNENLIIRGSKNAQTPELISELKKNKLELVRHLKKINDDSFNGIIKNKKRSLMEPGAELDAKGYQYAPLSHSQERLWFLEQYQSNMGGANNLAGGLHIFGTLDIDACKWAFEQVTKRQGALRTCFEVSKKTEMVRQKIMDRCKINFEFKDLSKKDKSSIHNKEDAQLILGDFAKKTINLKSPPLFKILLIKISRDEYLLALVIHHLVADGWSIGILAQEWAQFYSFKKNGIPRDLESLDIQYSDYCFEQKASSKKWGEHIDYWENLTQDVPLQLDFPTDYPRPRNQSFKGKSVPIKINALLSQKLLEWCKVEGVTPFNFLLSAWSITLSKYSGQQSFLIGIADAGRLEPQWEKLVGFFVNTLLIHPPLESATNFTQLCHMLHDQTMQVLTHRDIPLSYIVEKLEIDRDTSRPPLFQSMFSYQEVSNQQIYLDDLQIKYFPLDVGATNFECSLYMDLKDGMFSGEINFATALFEHNTMDLLAQRFEMILKTALSNTSKPYAKWNILLDGEKSKLLSWAQGSYIASKEIKNGKKTEPIVYLWNSFIDHINKYPDSIAIKDDSSHFTFGNLKDYIDAVCIELSSYDFEKESLIAINADRSIYSVANILGILAAGFAYLPIDPKWPKKRIDSISEDISVQLHISEIQHKINEKYHIIQNSSNHSSIDWKENIDQLAYVIYTSGTTGKPKGVEIERSSIVNLLKNIEFLISPGKIVSVNAPLFFDASVKQIFQILWGHQLVLVPENIRINPIQFIEWLERESIELLDITPSLIKLIFEEKPEYLPKEILVGGEKIDLLLWNKCQKYSANFYNLFGPTETTDFVTIVEIKGPESNLGNAIDGVEIYVLDNENNLLPPSFKGEIYIAGKGLARGYRKSFRDSPLNEKEKIFQSPFIESAKWGKRLYRTGDLGTYSSTGKLKIYGRNDSQVKIRGNRVDTQEIDIQLRQNQLIQDSFTSLINIEKQKYLVSFVKTNLCHNTHWDNKKRFALPNGLYINHIKSNETLFLYNVMFKEQSYTRYGVRLNKGDTVFDVGSNIGMFTLSAHLAIPELNFFNFEPNPDVHKVLKNNLTGYDVKAKIFNYGISDIEKVTEFTYYPRFTILSGLYADQNEEKQLVRSYVRKNRKVNNKAELKEAEAGLGEVLDYNLKSNTISVRLRPISDVIREQNIHCIDLLKINVEKAELDVLLGIDDEHWPLIQQISLEVHDIDGRLDKIKSLFTHYGFHYKVIEDWFLEDSAHLNYYIFATRERQKFYNKKGTLDFNNIAVKKYMPLKIELIQDYLKQYLPDYMIPNKVISVNNYPLTSNGKIDSKLLKSLVLNEDRSNQTAAEPEGSVEIGLASLWTECLHIDAIYRDDDFFKLGGESLLAAKLSSLIIKKWNIRFSVAHIFEHSRLRYLADFILKQISLNEGKESYQNIPVRQKGSKVPLSPAQERFYLLEEMEPGLSIYSISGAFKIKGDLDQDIFEQSLDILIKNNEILTQCYQRDSEGIWSIESSEYPKLLKADLPSLDQVHKKLKSHFSLGFDIHDGPLAKFYLYKYGDNKFVLGVHLHHIIADGYMVSLLAKKIGDIYSLLSSTGNDKKSKIDELKDLNVIDHNKISYADYACYMQSYKNGVSFKKDKEYWLKYLSGIPYHLDLPNNNNRPHYSTGKAGVYHFKIPEQTKLFVENNCRESGVTPFNYLLALYALLLHRVSQSKDFCVGIPYANRDHDQLKDLPGLLVNTLPVRIQVGDKTTLREFIRSLQNNNSKNLFHGAFPFEKVVEYLNHPRDIQRHGIFQHFFAYQEFSSTLPKIQGAKFEEIEFLPEHAKFDLSLVIENNDDNEKREWISHFEYGAEIFDLEYIQSWADMFVYYLQELRLDQNIADIHFLTGDHREYWSKVNRIGQPYELPKNVLERIETIVEENPESIAIIDMSSEIFSQSKKNMSINYRDLWNSSQCVQHSLVKSKLDQTRPIGICMGRHHGSIVSLLGVLRWGGHFLLIDKENPLDRLEYLIEDSQLSTLIVDNNTYTQLKSIIPSEIICHRFEDLIDLDTIKMGGDEFLDRSTSFLEKKSYLIYTSGSTGRPKASINTHLGLANLVEQQIETLRVNSKSKVLHFSNFSFDASISEIFCSLCSGSSLHVADREKLLPGPGLVDLIEREQITHWTCPPTILESIPFKKDHNYLNSLKVLVSAGEECSPELAKKWGKGRHFLNAYGPSEAGVCASMYLYNDKDLDKKYDRISLPIGQVINGAQIWILDNEGNLVPPGIHGEIVIGGAGVSLGYLNQEDSNSKSFYPASINNFDWTSVKGLENFSKIGSMFYRTGDIGYLGFDQNFYFKGRSDHQVKIRGYRIELGEVEQSLGDSSYFGEVCVVARYGPTGEGHQLCLAAFVTAPIIPDWKNKASSYLASKLPYYCIPSLWDSLEFMPRNQAGKIDRKILVQRKINLPKPNDKKDELNKKQIKLLSIFQRTLFQGGVILNVGDFHFTQHFFKVGGHSLIAAGMIQDIENLFSVSIPLRILFEYDTPSDLYSWIQKKKSNTDPIGPFSPIELNEIKELTQYPLTENQRQMWYLQNLSPSSDAYWIESELEFDNDLSLPALQWAFKELLKKHRVLRTYFKNISGEPQAHIRTEVQQILVCTEEQEYLDQIESFKKNNVLNKSLIQAVLFQKTKRYKKSRFTLSIHHSIIDGYSLGILAKELETLYNRYVGQENGENLREIQKNDKPQTIDFLDICLDEKQNNVDPISHTNRSNDLISCDWIINLPTDFSRNNENSFIGRQKYITLENKFYLDLRKKAQELNASPFMLIKCCFAYLMLRISGQSSFLLGCPLANRNISNREMIGLFVNTGIICVQEDPKNTFAQFVENFVKNCFTTYAHPNENFENWVKELNPVRENGINPLFQVMVVQESGLISQLDFKGTHVQVNTKEKQTAKVDLTLFVTEDMSNNQLSMQLEYNSAIFESDTIDVWGRSLEYLLKNFDKNFSRTSSFSDWKSSNSISLLNPKDQKKLDNWNATKVKRDYSHFAKVFNECLEQWPDETALRWESNVKSNNSYLTYKELDHLSSIWAVTLIEEIASLGSKADMVGIYFHPCAEMIVAILAVFKAGKAYVPMDPGYPKKYIKYILKDSGVNIVITQKLLEGTINEFIEFDGNTSLCINDLNGSNGFSTTQLKTLGAVRTSATDLAYMIYTSGSTGRPKGVLIEHKSLLNYIFWLNKSMGSKPGDITPLMGSISFDATISSLLAPLLVGMSIEILSQNNRFSFLVRREERDRPFSYCKITPSHLKMMNHQLDSINHNLKLPHTLLIGGEALEGDSLDWWVDNSPDTQIINEYGPTETVVGCTAHKILAGSITKGKIPIGLPIDNTQIFIINSYGQILPHGSIGELVICGDGVGRGYHNMADTTAEKFVDLYLPSGKTLSAFRSGDLARWNAQGYLEYYGRKDTQVKLRGYRIELGEIEMMIQEHPAVIKAVVLVDKQNLDLLKAYVKISTEKRMDIEQVRAFVVNSLPNHMCPANWIQVDEFPLTQNGKLDLDYLDQLHSENKKIPNNKNLSAQPSSKTNIKGFHQKSLAGLWEDFLGCEVNYVEDDFFLLGGYSILASRLVSSIQKFYSVDVELAEIFDHSSIGAMSVLIKERKPSSNSALDPQDTTQNNISYSSKDEAQNGTPLPMLDSDRSSIELSIGQERFWILDQISGPNPVYNVPFIIGLNTALDRPALTLALDALAQRHSVFQTSIQTIDGKPELSLQIKEAIISKVEYSSIEKFIQKPFIIDQEPLYRWGICNDDQLYNEYGVQEVFISVLHHLITDGWSSTILIQELSRLYSLAQDLLKNDRRNSTVSNDIKAANLLNLAELPKIESNYYHFSKEQRNELVVSKGLDSYWTKRLQDASLKPALYPDYAYPSFPDYKGRVFSFEINKELSEKIHSFGQEIRMTPYMTFFSLWALYLMKRSSVNDITLGTAVSGRTQDKWLNIVGYFVNTLAINFRLTTAQNLLGYFAEHRAHILKDIEHQNMPFDHLIDLINVKRDASVSPVFQSFFVFQDSPASKLQFGENECTEINIPLKSSRYELTLAMDGYKSGSGSYECSFEYFSSLFTEHSIENLSISFRYFLEHISSIRQKKKLKDIVTSDLRICPPQHISKINSWNSTQKKYQEPSFIFDIIQGSFQKYAKEDALTFGSQSITYKQLDLLTLELAQLLRSSGLNGDDIVAVVMDRSIEMVVTILGIIRAGCAYMPLDPDSPKKRIQMILEDSKASLVFCNTQDIIIQHQESNSQDNFYLIECCLNPGSSLNITPDIDSIIDDHELIDLLKNPIIIKNTDLAYVIFTSGSTGQPKGVGNTYGALRNRLLWMQEKYPIGLGDVLLQKTPFTFDVSVWEFFWPFMYGARLHVLEPALHGDPYHLYDIMQKENISVVHFVPSILKVFLTCIETFQLPYLKHVISSGESLSWETLELFYQKISQSQLHNLYGPTEAAIDVSSWECDRNQYDKNISIGSPVSNTQLHILNPDGKTQPIGVPGELYIGGIQLARGYLNNPELTEKSFIQSDLAIDSGGQRLYRTGDLARWQWDGTIEFLGRIDHQVKIRGNRIELGEIEAHLLNLDHVINAIVDVRIGPAGQQLLIAWVQSSLPNYADDCRSHLLENLPAYMIPSNWVSIQEIPLNKNGKLDRKKLPKPNFVENEDIVPANSQLERKLIDLFCQVLGLQNTDHQTQVYTTSNFFTLGGDSILVIMFINEARKKDIEFSPTDLFRFQTPKALADHIKSHITREEIKYDPAEIQGPFPYTPALKWFRAQSKGRMMPNWYNQSSIVVPLRDLKAECIQATLNLLVKRHPSLRVRVQSFSELCILDSDTPNQFPLEIEKFSLNTSDSFETSSVISKILKKHQSSLNIHLDGGRPIGIVNKAIWFRSDQLEHQRLVFISHHIAVDAQTWPILLNDFEKNYPKIENQNFNFDKYNSGHSIVNYANALNDDYLASKHSIHLNVPSGSIEKANDTIIIPKMGSLKSKSEQFGISLEVLLLGTLAKSIGISVTIHRESTGRNLDQYNLECGSTAGWFTAVRALFYDADIDLISNLRTIQSIIINNQYNEPKHTAEYFNDYEPNGKNSRDSIKSGIDNCILFNFLGMIDLGESSDTLIFGKAPERELFSINPEYQAYPLEVNITLIHDQINIQLSVNSRFDKTGWGKELSSSYKLNKVCKILLKQWEKTLLEFQKEFHQSDHTSLLPVDQYQDRQNKTKPELQSIETKGSTFQYLVNISNNNSNLPNLFCVHPMGGTVFCYQKLAQSLPKYSVSAFQAQGLSQGEDPLDRVDEIASNYVKELQSYYPSGEILLLGWSFGGMVAAEMARQLLDQDRTIKWVGLLDIHAPGTLKDKTPSSDQAQLLYEIFAQDLDFNKRVLPPLNPDERLTFIAERGVANGIFPLGFGLAEAKLAWNTYMEHFKAEENFSLEKFNQKIPMSVIRSNQRSQEDDKTMGWGEYMIDIKNIYDIDTIHLNLLREPFLIHLIKLIKLI